MLQFLDTLVNFALLLMIVAGIAGWTRLIWSRRMLSAQECLESLVAVRERRRPFWTLADALLMFGAMILVTQAILLTSIRKGWIARTEVGSGVDGLTTEGFLATIAANSAGGLIAMAITLLWLRVFDPSAARRLGLRPSLQDVFLGCKGAFLILPPVLLISAAVNVLIPYEHPVLESLGKIASPTVFLATFIGTALVTPLVEEFLFRGLLQGSLQGMADRGNVSPWIVRATVSDESNDDANWVPRAWWPLIVASAVFAGMHSGQGAAPIPLFFLSLGVGYLYRQTGSLTPSIVVHMILNGMTLTVEFLKVSQIERGILEVSAITF